MRQSEVEAKEEESLFPPPVEKSCCQACHERFKLLRVKCFKVYQKLLYVSLFLLHHINLGLEVYFFLTVKVRFYYFALAHAFFFLLPHALTVIKCLSSIMTTGPKKCLTYLILDLLAINNIWDLDHGWFPCIKSHHYKKANYWKRMIFYMSMDFPLLTVKILNNMFTGNTFTLLQLFSILIQLLGLFSTTFKLRASSSDRKQQKWCGRNTLQKLWCLFLWVYLVGM